MTSTERSGLITMRGKPLTLLGNAVAPGNAAPDFTVLDSDLTPRGLKDYEGKIRVISVTPSLDTPTCDLQLHWFNEDAANQPAEVVILNISMDLPFAIRRFCAASGIDKAVALSDHREASFGLGYGVLIKELRLLARSIFIVDAANVVRYAQLVPEQSNEPDYEAALNALKEVLS